VGVLAGDASSRQGHGIEVREWILGHWYLGEGPVEVLEAVVDDGAHELGDPAEVVVDRHRRDSACGCHRACLDRGGSLLRQQSDRGSNYPFRHPVGCRIA
jgi:hypothetical protein